MDKFYELLRDYNRSLQTSGVKIPNWSNIYTDEFAPKYWKLVGQIADKLPREKFCVEIGSGMGDVLALLLYLGFSNICGFEKDGRLAKLANNKLNTMFRRSNCVLNSEYPVSLEHKPDLLIQVNCVYSDNLDNADAYLNRLRTWHIFNGVPEIYLLEVIDDSFQEDHPAFPKWVRLSDYKIRQAFQKFIVNGYETYQYPENTSSKRLYSIMTS